MSSKASGPLANALLPKRLRNVEELADLAGISRATAYRAFDPGAPDPSIDITIKIGDALELDPVGARDLIVQQRRHAKRAARRAAA